MKCPNIPLPPDFIQCDTRIVTQFVDFYQIYYAENQKSNLYPFCIPYFNSGLTVFFENSVIRELVMKSRADKISVCSHALREKLRWYIGKPRELTLEVLQSDYDVLSFTKNTRHHQMLAAADKWHPGFTKCFRFILEKIGVPMPHEVKVPIYQNHFSATRQIYQTYVAEYLIPTMWLMEFDDDVRPLAMSDSNYSALNKQGASPEELQQKIGMPYYPLAPFVLERLFSIFVHNNKIPVTWL